MINLIVSVGRDWGIGKNGELLFPIEQDMEFFKSLTLNKAVIMGRKTFDSLKKPLKDRTNIVLTSDADFAPDGVTVCRSINDALKEAEKYPEVFVIGGGEVYRQLLPYCNKAYVTKVDAEKDADSYMVNLDKEPDWEVTGSSKDFVHGEITYRFFVYERKQN